MQTTMTGNQLMKSPTRMAGTYQIAYDVVMDSGKKGTALFIYEYDKRDVMGETVLTTPEIVDEVRAFVGEDGPSAFRAFTFPKPEDENQNPEAVTEAADSCTKQAYGYHG